MVCAFFQVCLRILKPLPPPPPVFRATFMLYCVRVCVQALVLDMLSHLMDILAPTLRPVSLLSFATLLGVLLVYRVWAVLSGT